MLCADGRCSIPKGTDDHSSCGLLGLRITGRELTVSRFQEGGSQASGSLGNGNGTAVQREMMKTCFLYLSRCNVGARPIDPGRARHQCSTVLGKADLTRLNELARQMVAGQHDSHREHNRTTL